MPFQNPTISVPEYSLIIETEARFEASSATYWLCEHRQVTYLLEGPIFLYLKCQIRLLRELNEKCKKWCVRIEKLQMLTIVAVIAIANTVIPGLCLAEEGTQG